MPSHPAPARLPRTLAPLFLLLSFAGVVAAYARGAPPPPSAKAAGAPPVIQGAMPAPTSSSSPGTAAAAPQAPQVVIVDLNSAAHVDRAQCVVASAGAGAAYECGDLRLVHGVPGLRVRGRTRAPVLIYNSKHAHPRNTVHADVTLPAGATVPDSVIVAVTLSNGTVLSRRAYRGTDWTPGVPRRVTGQWDGTGSGGTRIDGYAWQVSTLYGGTLYTAPLVHGPYAIVDRSQSPYGAGWWVAGVEQLFWVPGGIRILWVGGDGSTRLYKNVAPGAYMVDSISRPDTLKSVAVGAETHYYRTVTGGAQIWFNALGQHYKTVTRLGHTTTFSYDSGRLSAITYPGAGLSHTFAYDASGRLTGITAPAGGGPARNVTLGYGLGDRRVTTLTDPDGQTVQIGYAPASTSAVATSRTDRRGTTVSYGYDAAWKLTSLKLPLAPGDTITSRFYAAESKGLGLSTGLEHVFTFLDGPRTDVQDYTSIWVTRWGAPQRIRDALGHETVLTRADPRYKALVTQMVKPGGLTTRAWYNARGNVDSTAVVNPLGDGRNAVARYAYDAVWPDFVSRITMPEGEVTLFAYDAATGNRTWEQAGNDPARRASFRYYPATHPDAPGMLRAVTSPGLRTDSVAYDAQGNVSVTVDPLGVRTLITADVLGRVLRTRFPLDSTQTSFQVDTTVYDLSDRPLRTESFGRAASGAVDQRLIVVNEYDPEGNVLSVSRSSVPDTAHIGTMVTRFAFDAAGRKVQETAPDNRVDSLFYDRAGNVVRTRDRRGYAITMAYDELNRLVRRETPPVQYADTTAFGGVFPRYPNCQVNDLCLPGDTSTFTFDAGGNLVAADNHDARIRRSYSAAGKVLTDSLFVRTWAELDAGGSFASHAYGLHYGYDLNGRRTWLKVPRQLGARYAASPAVVYDSMAYSYDPVTGKPAGARDVLGNAFGFAYDVDGLLERVQYPRGHYKEYTYDGAGRPTRIRQDTTATSSVLNDMVLWYDPRGKAIQVQPLSDLASYGPDKNGYSGLGALVAHDQARPQAYALGPRYDYERWTLDAMGNTVLHQGSFHYRVPSSDGITNVYATWGTWNTYAPATGRLTASMSATGSTHQLDDPVNCGTTQNDTVNRTNRFDAAGNLDFFTGRWRTVTTSYCTSAPYRDSALAYGARYFDAMARMRVLDNRSYRNDSGRLGQDPPGYEEYRYDALGRRVLRRARHTPANYPGDSTMLDLVQRFVWDGDQLVAEIQAPGGNAATVAQMEADTATHASSGDYFGRVLYLQGEGLDQPVSIVRMGFGIKIGSTYRTWDPVAIAPHWDHQGRGINHVQYGPTPRCQTVGSTTGCITLYWPGRWAYGGHVAGRSWPQYNYGGWFGSLAQDQLDGSGQFYRRNRYYDAGTGRFTQEDPIGLAGGVNAYGFAAGDPVNFSDPYGLCPMHLTGRPCGSPLEKRPLSLRGAASGEWNESIGEFGMVRNGGTRAHHGVDILADVGTPVTSVDEGRVVFADVAGGYGNTVIVAHQNREGATVSYTVYAHLASIEAGIAPGASVMSGQTLGASGQSGNARGTPPHLHFEIRKKLNPAGGEAGLRDRINPKDEMDLDGWR